jgi:hypothetical protein
MVLVDYIGIFFLHVAILLATGCIGGMDDKNFSHLQSS